MMEFTNYFLKQNPRPRMAMETLVLLYRRWHRTWLKSCGICWDAQKTLAFEPWRLTDEALAKQDAIEGCRCRCLGSCQPVVVPADADAGRGARRLPRRGPTSE